MPRLLKFLVLLFTVLLAGPLARAGTGAEDRAYTVSVAVRIAGPVLEAAAEGQLAERMPANDWEAKRRDVAPLEAFGRTLVGLAPWLELGPGEDEEGRLRSRFLALALRGLEQTGRLASEGKMNFSKGGQPLVDAAFLAQALLRAPTQLWAKLAPEDQQRLVAALKATRVIKPVESNWLLFSAMVETALWRFTGDCNRAPIDYALRRHEEWYLGDGVYGDGPAYHSDYYNSYVIQPMLATVADFGPPSEALDRQRPLLQARARRYASFQERLISPEGTFPILGRSSAYRFGALQQLSDTILRRNLAPELAPGAVRSALTAVLRRMVEAPGTFDSRGWLQVGAVGHQPSIRERYISTGSLYLCLAGLLHLGLPAQDPFWTAPAAAWTQQRIWSGEDIPAEAALKDK